MDAILSAFDRAVRLSALGAPRKFVASRAAPLPSRPMLVHAAFVALAGALGTLGRWGVIVLTKRLVGEEFPWGTLLVNVLGSALLGLVLGLVEREALLSRNAATAIGVGFLGGFTTFSSFSTDALRLFESPARLAALAYVLANVLFGLLGAYGGLSLARLVARQP